MDKPKFSLNPDAEPFIPNFNKSPVVFERERENEKHEIPQTRQDDPVLDILFLSIEHPDYSEDSLTEVYRVAGQDLYEAERMLKRLEVLIVDC